MKFWGKAMRFLSSSALLLVFLSELKITREQDFPLPVATKLVISVQQYMFAGCLFLLQTESGDLRVQRQLLQMRSILSKQGIPSAAVVLELDNITELQHCRRNRPLIVVPPASTIRNRILDKVFLSPESFPCQHRWLLFSQQELAQVDAPFNCEVLVARLEGREVHISEHYRVSPELPHQRKLWGTWSLHRGLQGPQLSFFKRRSDLQGVQLRVIASDDPPFERIHELKNGEVQGRGFFVEVWKELESKLNYTTHWKYTEVNTGGSKQTNGSWSGMIGKIRSGQATVCVNRMSMTTARMEVIGYTLPIVVTKASALIRAPSKSVFEWTIFLSPFNTTLWYSVLISILFLICTLYLLQHLQNTMYQTTTITTTTTRILILSDCVLVIWGSYCGQVTDFLFYSWGGRLMLWVVSLTALTLRAAYSANLVAFFTAHQPKLPFSTLQEFMNYGSYNFGVVARSGIYTDFMHSSDYVMSELFKHFIAPASDQGKLPKNSQEGYQRVCNQKYVFMGILDYMHASSRELNCSITALPKASYPVNLGMLFPKHHPFLGVVNYNLLELQHSGVMRRLYLEDLSSALKNDKETGVFSVEIQGVLPLFYIFGLGLGIVLLIAAAERWIKRSRRRHGK